MTPRKRHPADTTARCTHEFTETVTVHTRPVQRQTRKSPSTERGSGCEGPTLLKNLFAMDTCWEREISFLQQKINYIPGQASRSGVVGQHKTDSMFVVRVLFVVVVIV